MKAKIIKALIHSLFNGNWKKILIGGMIAIMLPLIILITTISAIIECPLKVLKAAFGKQPDFSVSEKEFIQDCRTDYYNPVENFPCDCYFSYNEFSKQITFYTSGEDISAVYDGTVTEVETSELFDDETITTITIKHTFKREDTNKYTDFYSHYDIMNCEELYVGVGSSVDCGESIAKSSEPKVKNSEEIAKAQEKGKTVEPEYTMTDISFYLETDHDTYFDLTDMVETDEEETTEGENTDETQ